MRPSFISTISSAEISGFGQVVRDENGGLFQACENFLQILLQRRPNEWIERAERLVEQEHFRRKHERTHQADALALSAGKLGGITIESHSRGNRVRAQSSSSRCSISEAGRPRWRDMRRTLARAVRCGKSPPS